MRNTQTTISILSKKCVRRKNCAIPSFSMNLSNVGNFCVIPLPSPLHIPLMSFCESFPSVRVTTIHCINILDIPFLFFRPYTTNKRAIPNIYYIFEHLIYLHRMTFKVKLFTVLFKKLFQNSCSRFCLKESLKMVISK